MPKPKAAKPIVVNPNRSDPYKNFKFRMKFGGKIVAAATVVTGPMKKISGMHKSGDVTLKRGVISDSGFAEWLSQTARKANPPHAPATRRPTRRTLILEMRDETGKKAGEWKLHGCAVVAVDQSRSKDSIALASLTIQTESFEEMKRYG